WRQLPSGETVFKLCLRNRTFHLLWLYWPFCLCWRAEAPSPHSSPVLHSRCASPSRARLLGEGVFLYRLSGPPSLCRQPPNLPDPNPSLLASADRARMHAVQFVLFAPVKSLVH